MKTTINLGELGGIVETTIEGIDLDTEVVYLDGERLTEARAQKLATEMGRRFGARGGRPALTPGAPSRQKAVRLSVEQADKLAHAARSRGARESDVLRDALDAYLATF